MTKEEFRAELAALVEKARTDPKLGANGRWVVTQLFASGCLVAKFSGGNATATFALMMQLLQEVFPHTLEELEEFVRRAKEKKK
jgi:hypothetical protein